MQFPQARLVWSMSSSTRPTSSAPATRNAAGGHRRFVDQVVREHPAVHSRDDEQRLARAARPWVRFRAAWRDERGADAPYPHDLQLVPRVARAKAAHDEMVLRNVRLVETIGRRLRSGDELEDLVAVGLHGLHRAADRYDPERGVRFASFADSYIRGAMLDWLNHDHAVYVPDAPHDDARRVWSAQNGDADGADIASKVSPEAAQRAAHVRALRSTVSLDAAPAAYDGEGTVNAVGATVADPRAAAAFEDVLRGTVADDVHRLLRDALRGADGAVDDDAYRAFCLRWGLGSDEGQRTYREVGALLGMHEGRVRAIDAGVMAVVQAQCGSPQWTALRDSLTATR